MQQGAIKLVIVASTLRFSGEELQPQDLPQKQVPDSGVECWKA